MTILGWALVGFPIVVLLYTYLGYPAMLWLVARGRRPAQASARSELPPISVVVPAYNEEKQIAGKIEEVLKQDYPADRRQILVLSDASTDRTDEIVASYADRGVELYQRPFAAGKRLRKIQLAPPSRANRREHGCVGSAGTWGDSPSRGRHGRPRRRRRIDS